MAKPTAPLNVFQQFRKANPEYENLDDRAVLGLVSQSKKIPFNELESKYLPKDPIAAFRVKNPRFKDASDDEIMAMASQATGKSAEEIRQKITPPQSAKPKASDMTFGDFIKSTGVGVGDALSGLGYLAEKVGAEKVGKEFKKSGERYQKGFESRMTEAGKLALSKEIFEDDPKSMIGARLSDDAGAALLMTAGRSLPATVSAILPGSLATSALQGLAKLGLVGGASATIPLLAGTASGITKGAKAISAIPYAVGFGAAEGLSAGAMNAASLEASIKTMPLDELKKSPVFNKLNEQHGFEKARDMLAKQAADDVFKSTGLAVGAIGAATGGGVLSQLARKATGQAATEGVIKTVGKGVAGEAIQEAPQSGAEKYLTNVTEKELLDPSIDPIRGVTAATLSGATAGGLTGGVLSLPSARVGGKRPIPEAQPEQATTPTQTPQQAQSGPAAQAIEQAANLAKQASGINAQGVTAGMENVAKATNADEAIAAAQNIVSAKPTTPKELFETEQGRNELLNAINKSSVTFPGQPTEGLTYGQANETKQAEKTGETNSLQVLEAKAKKQLQIVEQNLVKENLARQGGDTSDRNQQAIEFLTRRKALLEMQITEQAYIPKDKIDELDRLITGQEQRKITNPDTWADVDQRVLDRAYAKRDELIQLQELEQFNQPQPDQTPSGDTLVAPEQAVEVEPTQETVIPEETAPQEPTSIFDRVENISTSPELPEKLIYERLSSPTTSKEQFAQDLIRLSTDKDTGRMPAFASAKEVYEYLDTRNLASGAKHPIDGDAILKRFDAETLRNQLQIQQQINESINNPDSIYSNPKLKVRKDITPELIEQGQKGYAERIEKAAKRVNATPLGIRMAQDFKEGNGASLVGQTASDMHDVAQLAQILRDPRFETLRVFLLGDGKILNHYGLTSRLPSVVSFNLSEVFSSIDTYMKNTPGATSFVLVHNHPSGDPAPSSADITVTKEFAKRVKGFAGHVVIDSNKYSVITDTGRTKSFAIDNKDFGKPGREHWAINLRLGSTIDLLNIAKKFQNKDGYFTLVGLDARLRVAALAEVPNTSMELDKLKLTANLRRFAINSGATKTVAVLPEGSEIMHHPKLKAAIKSGLINEVIDIRNGQPILLSVLDTKQVFGVGKKSVMENAPRKEPRTAKLGGAQSKQLADINKRLASMQQTQQQMAAQIKATNALKNQVKTGAEKAVAKAMANSNAVNLPEAMTAAKLPSKDMNQAQRITQVSGPTPTSPNTKAPVPPEVTTTESLRTYWQDNMIRMKTLQQWVEKESGKKLSEHADVYARENLSKATTANKIEDFRNKYVQELVKDAGKAHIDVNELAEYLEMRHIPEANAYQRFIHNDSAATVNGIPDAVANSVVKAYEARKDFAEFKILADRMWNIGEMTLNLRLDNGLISQEQVKAYKGRYEYWVPLRGDNVKRSVKDKRRFGHESRDEFVFENLVLGHEIAIMQAEQNKLGMSIAAFLIEADNPNIGTISAPRKFMTLDNYAFVVSHNGFDITSFRTKEQADMFIEKVRDKEKGTHDFVITKTSDPQVILRTRPFLQPNEVAVYINGHEVRMQINDETAANALNGVGLEGLSGLAAMFRNLMNYLSKSYTAWSPDFIFTNAARDIGGGTFALTGEYGFKTMTKIMARYWKSVGKLINNARGTTTKIVDDYRAEGGNTGAAYLEDIDRIGRTSVASAMEQMNLIAAYNTAYKHIETDSKRQGKLLSPGQIARRAALKTGFSRITKIPVIGHFLKLMEAINGVSENALRLATFEVLVGDGKSPQEAAFMAKNLMNFNRKGTIANKLGAAYLFFNPGMQGVQVFARAFVKSPHRKQVWALGASMAATSFLIAQFTRAGGDDDERRWTGIPGYVKDRNLVLDTGGAQVTLPVSYGFGVFHTFGNIMSDLEHGEKTSVAAWRLASALFTHFFVFGDPVVETKGEYDARIDMVFPTVVKLVMAPYTNMDGLGRPIYPFSFSDNVPDSQKMTRSARNTWYEGMAYTLNDITGGDKYTKGAIDVSPNSIKYWTESLTGGWGKFASDMVNMAMGLPQGVAPELENIPIVRKFARNPGIADTRLNFWTEANEVKREHDRLKGMTKDNAPELNFIPEEKRKDIITLYKLMDKQSKLAAKIRNTALEVQRDATLSLKERELKLKELERQEAHAYDTFIKHFDLNKGNKL